MKKKVSFLILVYNESKTIEQEIKNILKLKKDINFNLVVVQDGSNDGTFEKLNKLKKKYSFKLYNKENRLGYYNAFLKGVKLCRGKVIFFSDTGGKYKYENFIKFYKVFINQKADLVAGYRVGRKDKYLRRFLTFFYTLFINIFFFFNFKDYDCGFKIFNKKKLLNILKNNTFNKNLITSQIFIFFKLYNYRIFQLPIKYWEKKNRKSRGIPNKKIVQIIFLSLLNLLKIRLQAKSL